MVIFFGVCIFASIHVKCVAALVLQYIELCACLIFLFLFFTNRLVTTSHFDCISRGKHISNCFILLFVMFIYCFSLTFVSHFVFYDQTNTHAFNYEACIFHSVVRSLSAVYLVSFCLISHLMFRFVSWMQFFCFILVIMLLFFSV